MLRNYLFSGAVIILLMAFTYGCSKNANQEQSKTAAGVQSHDPDMVLIPAGEFIMGSDEVDASGKSEEFGFNEPMYLSEHPKRKVYLDAYLIDKYEVSNLQFKHFLIESRKYTPEQLQTIYQRLKMSRDDMPVRIVTWFMARQYCASQGKRLPSEAEWEKAARGENGFEYPWGNEWNPDHLNAGQEEQDLAPVDSYEKGKSPYGVYNMAGNVMEWVEDWYEAYPGSEYKSPFYGKQRRVVRGGGWGGVGHYVIPYYFRAAYRYNFPPDKAFDDVGFRCVKDVKP